jgi:hypothetical protein
MGVPGLVLDAAPRSARALCASFVDGGRGGTPDLSTPRRPSRPALCICFARSRWPVAMHCAHRTARTAPVVCATPDPASSGLDALHHYHPPPLRKTQRSARAQQRKACWCLWAGELSPHPSTHLHPLSPAATHTHTHTHTHQLCLRSKPVESAPLHPTDHWSPPVEDGGDRQVGGRTGLEEGSGRTMQVGAARVALFNHPPRGSHPGSQPNPLSAGCAGTARSLAGLGWANVPSVLWYFRGQGRTMPDLEFLLIAAPSSTQSPPI